MGDSRKRIVVEVLLSLCVFAAIVLGVSIGLFASKSRSIQVGSSMSEFDLAVPSQILDRKGRLITEFFGDEKRDIVPLAEIPKHLVYALLTREDDRFYEHHGFSIKGLVRAGLNILIGRYWSGGSTITQQLAGTLYADRTDVSIGRKLKELWWSLQLERTLTKNQIIELYMNEAFFGSGTHGVEAASQFYFGHSVRTITVAESAMLVIQLANPARYSPVRHPDTAKRLQRVVLNQMVTAGFASREEADRSFDEYWSSYDYTRPVYTSAFRENTSEAPYFSEYVRQEMEKTLFGKLDYFRDGLIVHTTLDLGYQHAADDILSRNVKSINAVYRTSSAIRFGYVEKEFLPVISMLALGFNLPDIDSARSQKARESARELYVSSINPIIEATSLQFGLDRLKTMTKSANALKQSVAERTTVENALITLDNSTGEILAMVGGSNWETSKFNRAVDARIQPGSAIKPLYYSAAISSGKFTPASRIYDGPIVFHDSDGEAYAPSNFLGEWTGGVLLRTALAKSMNVPSLQVLDGIGFDAAIDRMARLLGMENEKNDERVFPRVYPLGLGVTPVAPLNMARAYAVFANGGREVEPVAIKYVQDRKGSVILEPEKELRAAQKKRENALQIMSPQAAYVMVSLLESTIEFGTLSAVPPRVGGFDGMPMAGKTGTTQNWSDAWTVGFSPYYTTALWFGFDRRGATLGLAQTGATAAGPVWGEYMKAIHRDLPRRNFVAPESGLVRVAVDAQSGLLPTPRSSRVLTELFIAGTEPRRFDTLEDYTAQRDDELVRKLQNSEIIQSLTPGSAARAPEIGAAPLTPAPLSDSTPPALAGPLSPGTTAAGANPFLLPQTPPSAPRVGAPEKNPLLD